MLTQVHGYFKWKTRPLPPLLSKLFDFFMVSQPPSPQQCWFLEIKVAWKPEPGSNLHSWHGFATKLMVQKSGDHQSRLVVNPMIYRVLYIPGGCLGFLNHQQYEFDVSEDAYDLYDWCFSWFMKNGYHPQQASKSFGTRKKTKPSACSGRQKPHGSHVRHALRPVATRFGPFRNDGFNGKKKTQCMKKHPASWDPVGGPVDFSYQKTHRCQIGWSLVCFGNLPVGFSRGWFSWSKTDDIEFILKLEGCSMNPSKKTPFDNLQDDVQLFGMKILPKDD